MPLRYTQGGVSLRRHGPSFACHIVIGIALSVVIAWMSLCYEVLFPASGIQSSWRHHESTRYWGAEGDGELWTSHFRYFRTGVVCGATWLDLTYRHSGPEGLRRLPNREPLDQLPGWSRGRIPPDGTEPPTIAVFEVSAGWPITAWRGGYVSDVVVHKTRIDQNSTSGRLVMPPPGRAVWGIPVFVGSLEMSGVGRALLILPLRPIFPEAIWSVALYSALLFGLSLSVVRLGRARREGRARRGLCVGCAYPLGDLGECPECGRERACWKPGRRGGRWMT